MIVQPIWRWCGAVVLCLATLANAEPIPRVFESAEETPGTLRIEGSSNVRNWDVRGSVMEGQLRLRAPPRGADAPFTPEQVSGADPAAEVRIPVHSLTGGSRSMDRKMFDALDADRYPAITFSLSSLEENPASDAEEFPLMARGELRIRNRRRTIRIPVRLDATESGLRMSGIKRLRMTDYGVKPPRALFGALRTDDDIVVHFEWNLDEARP